MIRLSGSQLYAARVLVGLSRETRWTVPPQHPQMGNVQPRHPWSDVRALVPRSARSMRRPVEFRDRVEVVDPCLLRANKYPPAWHPFISLAQRSEPHVVGFW